MSATDPETGLETGPKTGIDEFLGGKVRLVQPRKGFRAGQDSVLAAAAVRIAAKQQVLDIGAGAGAISLCLLSRQPDIHVTAVEKQQQYTRCLQESANLNHVGAQIDILDVAIESAVDDLPATFDHVVMNPPYFDPATSQAPDKGRATARHGTDGLVDAWIHVARRVLKPKGQITIVYPVEGVPEILTSLQRGFGAVELIPVFGALHKPAKRILVRAIKNVRTPFSLSQGLYLRNADATPTLQAEAILRDGLGLDEALLNLRDAKE